MHSSRIRTTRTFTVCQSMVLGGVYLVPGGYLVLGSVPGTEGSVSAWSGGDLPVLGGVPAWFQGGVAAWSQGVYLPTIPHIDTFFLLSAHALRNCHGSLILKYIIDYLNQMNKCQKLKSEDIKKILYVVLNSMSKFIILNLCENNYLNLIDFVTNNKWATCILTVKKFNSSLILHCTHNL